MLRASSASAARWPASRAVVTWAIVPRRSANEMSFLSLPNSTSAGRPESRRCFLKRKYTDAVEAPCPPVVSRAKGVRREEHRPQQSHRNYESPTAILVFLLCSPQFLCSPTAITMQSHRNYFSPSRQARPARRERSAVSWKRRPRRRFISAPPGRPGRRGESGAPSSWNRRPRRRPLPPRSRCWWRCWWRCCRRCCWRALRSKLRC